MIDNINRFEIPKLKFENYLSIASKIENNLAENGITHSNNTQLLDTKLITEVFKERISQIQAKEAEMKKKEQKTV